jgi:hypothetical protein
MSAALGLGVYVNSETVLSYLFTLGIDVSQPQSLSAYHTPFPYNSDWLNDLLNRPAERRMVFCSELHAQTAEDLITLDQPGTELYICGVVNHEFLHAQVFRWMDWFHTSAYFYRQHRDFLHDRLRPNDVKPLSFDILLGCQRPNRDLVHNYIVEHQLRDRVLMTYFRRWNIDLRTTDQFIPEHAGLEYITTPHGTVHQVRYHGHRMCLSQVVPIDIYNQTAYTLVAETNGVNEFNFYTEKVVKPILARRLFVVIAGQHYLRNLRAMGFRTFDGVIDESYDAVADPAERYRRAMQQVAWLCQQPQQAILDSIVDITQHNCQLMTDTDWQTLDWPGFWPCFRT